MAQSGLAAGYCYRWVVTASDNVGNEANTASWPVSVDTAGPTVAFAFPASGEVTDEGATGATVAWTAEDAGSGLASQAVQRQRAPVSGSGCASAWADDGTPATGDGSLVATGLQIDTCYRWVVAATDAAGNTSSVASGALRLGATALAGKLDGGPVFSAEPLQVQTAETGIDRVEYTIDDTIVASSSQAPFSSSVDTATLADGPHTLVATVFHSDGTYIAAPTVAIEVANGLGSSYRLDADLAAGTLSRDDWVLNGLMAYAAPDGLPSRYASAAPSAPDDAPGATYLAYWSQLESSTQLAVTSLLDGNIGEFYGQPNATTIDPAEPGFTNCYPVWHGFDVCYYTTDHFIVKYVPIPATFQDTTTREEGGYMLGHAQRQPA